MSMPTISEVKTRIEAIAALMPVMVTPNMNAVDVLTPAMLYALDVMPVSAQREMLTIDGRYMINRTWELRLFVAQVSRTTNNTDAAITVAMNAAYAVAETLPALFLARRRLELAGNDPLVYSCTPLFDNKIEPVSFGEFTYSTILYEMKVLTYSS